MNSTEIRKKFLEFFKGKKHTVVPSDTLVPKNDPSLLFTSAGMNQFKEQFIGKNITFKRAASCQKCLRTGDLGNVGRTSGHHTFFEMLGNFSFGDYFKKEACLWAWEFMTEILKIPEEKLWISVYEDDAEAYSIWLDSIKVPKKKILKFGAKDNFWPADAPTEGPNGPCGPCSEIFYDWGKNVGCKKKDCNPSCDCGRFIEVWNLVFTQFNRIGENKLKPLPSKNIDTGMGLERITAVMQGVKTNFETDLFLPIMKELKKYNPKLKSYAQNAIADHLRAAVFCICDGISPSNEERGYVVRKLIRKAYLLSKANKPFLYNMVPKIAKNMQDVYPLLRERREDITAVIKEEEERFQNTLYTALPKLEDLIAEFKKERVIPGNEVFKLVDTYGLPFEIIEERARQSKYKVDKEGFLTLMNERKELSREKSKINDNIFAENVFSKAPKPDYSDKEPLTTKIAFMAKDEAGISQAAKGDRIAILTNPQSSLFYTEAGGQVGDSGIIENKGAHVKILNTRKIDTRVIHDCVVDKGNFNIGDAVTIKLDRKRNHNIAKNHTATHLLHCAMKKILGEHVRQFGSLVEDKRLRFDFTHMKKLSTLEIEHIEDFVNGKIKEAIALTKKIKDRAQAEKEGAIALFGEKYGETVRVVSIGDCSKELCGGTHVDNSQEIELFKITSESSIASGVRRIEAVTGEGVSRWLKDDISKLLSDYELAKKSMESEKDAQSKTKKLRKIISGMENIKDDNKSLGWKQVKDYARGMKPDLLEALDYLATLRKGIEKKQKAKDISNIEKRLDELLKKSASHKGALIIAAELDSVDMNILRNTADKLKKKTKSAFIALATAKNGRVNMVITFTDDIKGGEVDASTIIKESAKVIDGSGGGRKDFAQAGGSRIDKVKDALEVAKKLFIRSYM